MKHGMRVQANAALADTSRQLKQAETGKSDLQRRVEELDRELQTASGDSRRFQEELIQLKKANDDLQAKLDALTRENNKLNGISVTLNGIRCEQVVDCT